MKNRFFNYILAFMFISCLCFKATAQNIEVESKLQQYTIRIGDQTKLFLTVHQPAAAHVNFPKLTDTITGKIQIVNIGKRDTTQDKTDPKRITVIQGYTITSFDAGTQTIPSFAFDTTGGVLKTYELTLQVETVKVDTTKAIYDIKQPLAVSYTFFDWLRDNWYWVALSVVGVLAIIWLIWYLRKRPKKEPIIQIVKPGLPPHEIALNKLRELIELKLWQQDEFKRYYSDLSDIIREYLEKRYMIKTHEKTTDEIFESLRYVGITNEDRNLLRQILTLADLVKFAKEKPLPVENEQSMYNAINFVIQTQEVEQKENAKGGNGYV
jgi:hypothetical protein